MTRLDVAVVGPGRVGTVLAAALVRAGHRVVAVGGGSDASRDRFVSHVAGARPDPDPAVAARGSDLVLFATPDDVLEQVVRAVAAADALREGQYVVHVAGSRGLDVLSAAALAGARVAACHPAQTVPSGRPDPDVLVGAAWAVTAATDDLPWAEALVTDVGGEPHRVPDATRPLYHAALTVASNAVGAAVAVARQLLVGARVDDPAAFLTPLVAASTANVIDRGADALTGPVVRGDAGTIARHLATLDADVPHLATAYRNLTAVILDQVRPALTPEQATAIEAALSSNSCADVLTPE